ncbi:MAG: hypothetical protein E7284_04055 [Lachnospiraceae bacterium]|nr:hypothetical protein [Lachnospiraceae bacterium]
MNYKLESNIIYIIFAIVFSFIMWIYIYFCRKYKDKKKVYKWFVVIPYAEMIVSLILLCVLCLNNFDGNVLFLVMLGLMLLPFMHLFMFYYVPYGNEKVPLFKRIQCLIILFCYVVLFLGLLYCFYSGVFLFGFGNKQPVSIEVIQYQRPEGKEKSVLIIDDEEILDLYDAIRHAKIQEVQFDSDGLETDGDWVIILHFENEDISLCTQGEGMKDSIYFRRYLSQNDSREFIEFWLDNSMLMGRLQDYN